LAPANSGRWAIQVGAFANPTVARAVAAEARRAMPDLLGAAEIALPATTPFGRIVLYRARLTALSEQSAAQACVRLSEQQTACMAVPPGH
ncbi:MAG: SPOR domain-containing protein, partial [Pseudomonadota bacterium]|nr:SPOR domain-containing protein [Pseudomonadota bacterium]